MNIRLQLLQEDLWAEFPIKYFSYNKFISRKQKKNFHFANLLLCKQHNIDFNINTLFINLRLVVPLN
jgi:hypothetical protein